MAILNIRNLPEDVHRLLRIRAARAGRSMEAEARAILLAACRSDTSDSNSLQDMVDQMYGAAKPSNVVEDLIADRRREAQTE